MIVIICIVSVLVLFGVLYYLFPVIQITGDSMSPTYHDGEIIIGTRLYKKDNLEVGDVYNVTDTGKNYAWNGTTWDELGGDIDLERALKAKERALQRLQSKDPNIDIKRAQLALNKSLARINTVNYQNKKI